MKHLDELQKARYQRLYLLTPEDVLPPPNKSFVVSLQQFGSETRSMEQSNPDQSVGQESVMWTLGSNKQLHSKGCPFCGKQHIPVQYFGHNHICLNCRKYLKTSEGLKVRIVLGTEGDVHAYAREEGESIEIEVDNQDLYIFKTHCYTTFGDESELIVLPYDN